MIYVSERIVLSLEAEFAGSVGVDGDVKWRLRVHDDSTAFRVQEVPF